jgi:hypothetical protein
VRGLRPHTIHPIEAYWAFWEPSDDSLARAKRIIDWTVKNRGNYVEWVALDDISISSDRAALWKPHTKAIVDYAHARGITVGIGIQLYQTASLQNGYTLLSKFGGPSDQGTIEDGLSMLFDAAPFDVVDLSFGEFSGNDPANFITSLNMVSTGIAKVRPGAKLAATVHVGNYPNLYVDYMGEHILYYFLVKYADPPIVPWIHSVMYYDLFEDAGGAYLYDEFTDHRQFLLDRLAKGQPIGYFPETAYWVAFDDSVPTYLPLYARSRFVDLQKIRDAATSMGSPNLDEHYIFSSGWEWGYWQQDYATLRMSHTLPSAWGDEYTEMFAPWGAAGQTLSQKIIALGEAQHDSLMGQRLAAYLAGRDDVIDVGATHGTVSQPARPAFGDVIAMSSADRQTFAMNVVAPLDALAKTTAQLASDVAALGLGDDPWVSEIIDGMQVDADRTAFAHAVWAAAVSLGDGQGDGGHLAEADAALADAKNVVAHRHAHLHDSSAARLTQRVDNSTLYKYGYLFEADTLCYWQRERTQIGNAAQGTSATVPPCIF